MDAVDEVERLEAQRRAEQESVEAEREPVEAERKAEQHFRMATMTPVTWSAHLPALG